MDWGLLLLLINVVCLDITNVIILWRCEARCLPPDHHESRSSYRAAETRRKPLDATD